MPMSTLNAALVFVSASNTMKMEWNKGAAKKGINVNKAGAKSESGSTAASVL
jgi:hypothetical protein